LIKIK